MCCFFLHSHYYSVSCNNFSHQSLLPLSNSCLFLFLVGDKNFIKRQEKKRVTRRAEKLEARKKRSTPVAWHPQNKTLTRKRKWTHLSPRANAAAAAAAAAAGAGAQEATVM